MSTHSKLYRRLNRHILLTFMLMTISFLLFGILTLDLVRVLTLNASYIVSNGWSGLMDGGLQQFLELCGSALGAMAFYVLFKLCEHVMTDRLSHIRRE
ncbi:hypothetical protein [Undibacterium sp. RuTC16W]|uniref:hypothetical protein n=1 Tax=Undibacterium sp. RuTC16W TaxID=3413048 RepID=UPI003BF2FD81